MARPICKIAREVAKDWTNPTNEAQQWIIAMLQLTDFESTYYLDTAEEIVTLFLDASSGWKGPVANKVKKELRSMLKDLKVVDDLH